MRVMSGFDETAAVGSAAAGLPSCDDPHPATPTTPSVAHAATPSRTVRRHRVTCTFTIGRSNHSELTGVCQLNARHCTSRPRTEPARPIGIELEDGTTCRARLGGSWSAQEQHPDYYGAFYCQGGTIQADYVAVWSPPGSDDGITKNSDGWTVEVGGSKGPLTTLKVTKAYYVGIA